ncbi:unnamed protein product [Ambrosiozyma monospora]|uniref:Unnamed protein product n=1 Tax=Ambrosiozyma monospora TaxID=43982 RepID=A0A9W7DIH2_AMBMO|nr:unnamed protein product [Ambrosiozyma monospora]
MNSIIDLDASICAIDVANQSRPLDDDQSSVLGSEFEGDVSEYGSTTAISVPLTPSKDYPVSSSEPPSEPVSRGRSPIRSESATPKRHYTSPRRKIEERLVHNSEAEQDDGDEDMQFPDKIDKFEKMTGGAPKPRSFYQRLPKHELEQLKKQQQIGSSITTDDVLQLGSMGIPRLTKRRKHTPKRKKTLERLKSMTSIDNLELTDFDSGEEFVSQKLNLLATASDMDSKKDGSSSSKTGATNKPSTVKEKFINLLADRLSDLSKSPEYRTTAVHPSELYRRFSAPNARTWEKLQTVQKEPYYKAFKRYYERFLSHISSLEASSNHDSQQQQPVVDEETFELIQDIAEICLEFNDISSPIVLYAISRSS